MNPPFTYRPKSPGTNIGGYRYFFNGQECDNEIFGEVANFGYEFRQYDSRIARWWSVDPKWSEYPSVSPFVFCNGSPVMMMDLKGEEAWEPDGKGGWIAQQGDNAWTLHKDAGISYEKAKDLMKEQGFVFTHDDQKVNVQIGDRVQVSNYTNSKYDIPYKQPASGRIDYSPFNIEDVVFLMLPIKFSIEKIGDQVFRNRAARLWKPGSFKSSQKWTNQFINRGWTKEQVTETIKTGKNYQQINRIHPKNGATRFQNKETGKSVVIDNKTYELLQVGGEGFKW